MNTINNINKYLQDHGVKPSVQRTRIFEYLVNTKAHPSVDTIYNDLVDEIPTLSKTTVYNTLKLFVNKHITNMITIEEAESRFDADMSHHGHFKCSQCNTIYDFDFNIKDITSILPSYISAEEIHIYTKGLCTKCSKQK